MQTNSVHVFTFFWIHWLEDVTNVKSVLLYQNRRGEHSFFRRGIFQVLCLLWVWILIFLIFLYNLFIAFQQKLNFNLCYCYHNFSHYLSFYQQCIVVFNFFQIVPSYRSAPPPCDIFVRAQFEYDPLEDDLIPCAQVRRWNL